MALYRSPDYQTSLESIGLCVQEKSYFNTDFQDGSHLGFPIRMILALLALILPMKFNWPFGSG